MFRCLKFSTSILYADDTTIFVVGPSSKFMKLKLQQDLNSMSQWLQQNHLKLNIQKTKCMLSNKDGLFPNIELCVDDEVIEMVGEYKFLGIVMDNLLNFVKHFKALHEKL